MNNVFLLPICWAIFVAFKPLGFLITLKVTIFFPVVLKCTHILKSEIIINQIIRLPCSNTKIYWSVFNINAMNLKLTKPSLLWTSFDQRSVYPRENSQVHQHRSNWRYLITWNLCDKNMHLIRWLFIYFSAIKIIIAYSVSNSKLTYEVSMMSIFFACWAHVGSKSTGTDFLFMSIFFSLERGISSICQNRMYTIINISSGILLQPYHLRFRFFYDWGRMNIIQNETLLDC